MVNLCINKHNKSKYIILISIVLLFIFSFASFLIILGINVHLIQQCANNNNYSVINATLIDIKNSTLITDNIYIKYDLYFDYDNKIENATILCNNIECVNNYKKYNINDQIILYLQDNIFKLKIEIAPCIVLIFIIPILVIIAIFTIFLLSIIIIQMITSKKTVNKVDLNYYTYYFDKEN